MKIIAPKRLMQSVFPTVRNGSIFNASSLDLQFARTKTLDPRITFTRASSGTFVGSDGMLKTATTNEARFDHNPTTGESLGLLVEEQRTNSIRNNTMVGAVAGTPGTLPTNWSIFTGVTGLTREIVGTGTLNGITYIDLRLTGTPSASGNLGIYFENSTSTTAATAQTWTQSGYIALVSGSLTGISNILQVIIENTGAGAYVTQKNSASLLSSLSSSLLRYTHAATLNGGATVGAVQPVVSIGLSGAAIDITIRIGLPQLEQGAFATSVIPTTTAAATRSADVASITGANFSSWYRQDEGTVFASGQSPSTNRVLLAIDDGSMSNRYQMAIAGGYTPNFAAVSGGSVSADIYTAALSQGATANIAAAYRVNDFALSSNGSNSSIDTVGILPVSPSVARVGVYQNGSGYLNGTIRRLTYWPQRLPNATLQQITQP